jgi:hypothetical protein
MPFKLEFPEDAKFDFSLPSFAGKISVKTPGTGNLFEDYSARYHKSTIDNIIFFNQLPNTMIVPGQIAFPCIRNTFYLEDVVKYSRPEDLKWPLIGAFSVIPLMLLRGK